MTTPAGILKDPAATSALRRLIQESWGQEHQYEIPEFDASLSSPQMRFHAWGATYANGGELPDPPFGPGVAVVGIVTSSVGGRATEYRPTTGRFVAFESPGVQVSSGASPLAGAVMPYVVAYARDQRVIVFQAEARVRISGARLAVGSDIKADRANYWGFDIQVIHGSGQIHSVATADTSVTDFLSESPAELFAPTGPADAYDLYQGDQLALRVTPTGSPPPLLSPVLLARLRRS